MTLVGAKVLAVLASIDPVDAKTFELKLKKLYPNLLFALGSGIGQIPVIMRARDLDGDPSHWRRSAGSSAVTARPARQASEHHR